MSWWHGSCGLNGSCKESGIQAGQHHLATGGLPSTPRGEEPGPDAIAASHILSLPSRTGGQGLALHPEASGKETRMPGHPNNGPVQPCGSLAFAPSLEFGSSLWVPVRRAQPHLFPTAQVRELLTSYLWSTAPRWSWGGSWSQPAFSSGSREGDSSNAPHSAV